MSPLQARYILQYIQTFTIDTLTAWRTIAAGQRPASGSAERFINRVEIPRSRFDCAKYVCKYLYRIIVLCAHSVHSVVHCIAVVRINYANDCARKIFYVP